MNLVCELPSVKAFYSRMEELSRGTVHGIILTDSADEDGFVFYVGEDHDDHTTCWNRFHVNRRTRVVSVITP